MSGPLATVLTTEPLNAAAVQAATHVRAAGLRPFRVMLATFGKSAARDISTLRHALTVRSSRLSQAALDRGWQAAANLGDRLRQLPPGPDRDLLAHELEQSLQSLLSRDTDFITLYTDSITAATRAAREGKRLRALAALGDASLQPAASAAVIARLSKDLQAATPELIELWERLFAVPQARFGIERAAAIAAERARAMDALLTAQGISAAERAAALWGHVVKVRGELGEAIALHAPEWLVRRGTELERARRLAYRMGPGHRAMYLTQAEHGLLLNGAEGPDALIAIVHRREARMFDVSRVQVKVAGVSEGAAQNVNDILRRVGLERNRTLSSAYYQFRLSPGGPLITRAAASSPDVTTRLFLMNAAGGRTPAADLELLRRFGMPVDEIGLGFTVDQLSHGAISLCESAISLVRGL